jgi:hypothetical protein
MTIKSYCVLDLDDFEPERESNALDILFELKSRMPDFKVTLFTILGRWENRNMLFDIAQFPWIRFAAHGMYHMINDEVLSWEKSDWYNVLNDYESMGIFDKGFKAPNWEMTRLGYQVLKDMGWWVAIRSSQRKDVPDGMQYYSFEETPGAVHGHTWTLKPDLNTERYQWYMHTKFDFISNHLTTK